MGIDDLRHRFKHHVPSSAPVIASHERLRALTFELALEYVELAGPDSREKSLAITRLEEALMWVNAAIARNRNNDRKDSA